jgi:hypothetical protein
MLPIRHKSIFKSRWMALLWAAGIVWTAVDFAGGRSQGDGNAAVSNDEMADLTAAANAFDGAGK